uniref:ARAD1C18964p n=1 Tax=Blastobotrys adeninivorans TaxID=409370 RepID=A0A060T1U0_BLAAD
MFWRRRVKVESEKGRKTGMARLRSSKKKDKLPGKVSEWLNRVPLHKRWLVRRCLMQDSVKSQLTKIEKDPLTFKGLEFLLTVPFHYLMAVLLSPKSLIPHLDLLARIAERIEHEGGPPYRAPGLLLTLFILLLQFLEHCHFPFFH